jgi:hypothetical protein
MRLRAEGDSLRTVAAKIGVHYTLVHGWEKLRRDDPGWPHDKPGRVLDGVTHGTRTAYRKGCRCNTCRDRIAALELAYQKRRYIEGRRMVPALGPRRRIEALMRLGWTATHIADAAGLRVSTVHNTSQKKYLLRENAAAIGRAYDELSMSVGPSRHTASVAQGRGYAPPLAWDDIDDPDERPKYGRRDKANPTRLPDVDILVAEVNSAGLHIVGERYGVAPASVGQYLNRRGYYASSTGDKYDLPIYRRKAA